MNEGQGLPQNFQQNFSKFDDISGADKALQAAPWPKPRFTIGV